MKTTFSTHALALISAAGLICTLTCSAAEDCSRWSDPANGYSVCLPNDWYHRTMPSGAVFLCDDLRGACTIAVGGGPLLGHATMSLVPAQVALKKAPATLEEFAHKISDKDASSQFSKAVSEKGRFATLTYILVSQTYTTSALNDTPLNVYRYFVQADGRMIEVILTFNSGDERAQTYRDVASKIIASVRPEEKTDHEK